MKRWFQIASVACSLMATLAPSWAQVQETVFNLTPQAKFVNCLGVPYGPTPTADVVVQRGALNDVLILRAHHLKPDIGFDLFTIQDTNLLADSQADPNFKNFGLAWYQADVEADANGEAEAAVKTILLDQIFGFDPAVALPPTQTLHVGLWFDKPTDAGACGFNINKPIPFNGSHNAGPNAMISLPSAQTNLGPLCTAPPKQGDSFVCNINN
jgi:hypothetical protein